MTDFQLLAGVQAHDYQAFDRLVTEYSEDLLIAAYAFTRNAQHACEIVRDVLLELWSKGPSGNCHPSADAHPALYTYLHEQIRSAAIVSKFFAG